MFWENDLFDEFRRLQQEMQRMRLGPYLVLPEFRKKGEKALQRAQYNRDWPRIPKCELCETESSFIANFELPGVDKKDIRLNINKDSIEVKVEKKQEKEVKKKGSYRYDSSSKSFYRSLPLPKSVDPSKSTAVYKNGMLRVEAAKAKKEQSKSIEIK